MSPAAKHLLVPLAGLHQNQLNLALKNIRFRGIRRVVLIRRNLKQVYICFFRGYFVSYLHFDLSKPEVHVNNMQEVSFYTTEKHCFFIIKNNASLHTRI